MRGEVEDSTEMQNALWNALRWCNNIN